MVVYTVFSQNVSTFYKTTLCSKSTVFIVITTFLTFFIPLLIAYRSQGFWLKSMSYREQPLVKFKHEYFVQLETADPDAVPIICATIRKKTEFLESLDKCTSIKFFEEDKDGDGKLDNLSMEITVSDTEPLPIQSLNIVLTFSYILQHHCLVEMEAVAAVTSNVGYPASRVHVQGDLSLQQRSLLPCRGRHLAYNHSAFDNPHVNLQELIREHALQSVATRFTNEIFQWTRGQDTSFTIQLDVTYPEVAVTYRPGFWHVMKWAWIQYFAILIIFAALHQSAKRYVFLNHLLPTVPVRPWKTAQ